MKLSVRLGNEMAFSVNVEGAKARAAFVRMAQLLISESEEADETAVTVALHEEAQDIDPITEAGKMGEEPQKVSKKLVFFTCKSCDTTNHVLANDGDDAQCKNCGDPHTLGESKRAVYECPNCGCRGNIFLEEGDETVKCKQCKAPVDFLWNEKKNAYLSANMN